MAMAMLPSVSAGATHLSSPPPPHLLPSSLSFSNSASPISFPGLPTVSLQCRSRTLTLLLRSSSAVSVKKEPDDNGMVVEEGDENAMELHMQNGGTTATTYLYSLAPLPLLFFAALPGAGTLRSAFAPFVELVKSWNLPELLVHWGHPGNMAVVLFAMGGYGTYLGFRIRYSDDVEEKAKAKDLHPKLLGGMFFFFALGATGGITSLLTSDKPILESPHAVTAFVGLALLTLQTILPSLFEGNPGLRNIHGILGSGIMALFIVHATLGLQLALSF